MGVVRLHRQQSVASRCLAGFLVAVGVILGTSVAAFGDASLSVNVSTGLNQAQSVVVSGSGFADTAFGYVVECNMAPGEPTLTIGPPFFQLLPVGCSPPTLKRISMTSSTGTLTVAFIVHESRKLGPPCGISTVLAGCPSSDSANLHPRHDAQNYPCPPSPAQQAKGITCALVWFDSSRERVSTPISFSGAGPPVGKGGGGGGGGGGGATTTLPRPTTTLPRVTTTIPTTTAPRPTIPVTVVPTTAHPVVKAASNTLAFTGIGTTGIIVAVIGGILVLFGILLFFVDVRKAVLWILGL